MPSYYIARETDNGTEYNEEGYAVKELLPGTYQGGIRNYKYYLKAGCEICPELQAEDMVLIMFGKGKGYILSDSEVYDVTEPAFFVPDFAKEAYTVHALEDMEFVLSTIKMNRWDKEKFNECHNRLPFFRLYTDGDVYDQSCKGPNTTSWLILGTEQLGRIMVGVVRAVGEGTVEAGHPQVEQWNYCLGDSDFWLKAGDDEPVRHVAGEFSYIPAGYDHSLVADPGKEVFYVWYEHYTRERDFCVCLADGDDLKQVLRHEENEE